MSADWTNGLPRVATEKDCAANWNSGKNGKYFRCSMCGHRFVVGDVWRWVYCNDGSVPGSGNFMVCAPCDGPDVKERRADWMRKFSWMFHE